MFLGEFREDVIGAKQIARCQATDCSFSKFDKDDLKKEQRTGIIGKAGRGSRKVADTDLGWDGSLCASQIQRGKVWGQEGSWLRRLNHLLLAAHWERRSEPVNRNTTCFGSPRQERLRRRARMHRLP